jgi:hypothetical protein
MFIHVVLFWLKDGTPEAKRQRVIDDCHRLLGKIPTVRHLWIGRPAMTPRTVVDNSYHVGLCVALDDPAAHDVYQEHALHKEFIANNSDCWQRVQVYDFK